MVQIIPVRTKEDADSVRILAYEFIDWLNQRYPEMVDKIADYLTRQKFDDQIRDIRAHYCPPNGECLLAVHDDEPVGILMLKDLGDRKCEMNRMFVRPGGRGLGIGRSLVQALKEQAVGMGFKTMVLSALPRHNEAIALYKSAGFLVVEPPETRGSADVTVYMSLDLV